MSAVSESDPPISFSVILEGNTITTETQDSILTCLDFLSRQGLSPALANEFLLMDPGNLGGDVLQHIHDAYPWLTIKPVPPGTGYFETKMAGVPLVTGEVVVFCDGDNRYLDGWLEAMVRPFAQDPDLNVLVGQTSVEVTSLKAALFALTFFFPPFSRSTQELTPSSFYFGNNMAFRRRFLLLHPIPTNIPLLRGNDYVHSVGLVRDGHQIWRQNWARAYHDPPEFLSELVYRYLARGSDRLQIWRLTRQADSRNSDQGLLRSLLGAVRVAIDNAGEFLSRSVRVPRQSLKALLYYPVALPLGVGLLMLVMLGMAISIVRPGTLVKAYLEHQYSNHSGRRRSVPDI